VVEPHKPDDLLAVGEEEEPESLIYRLGEAVIGEGVKVRASGEEVVEGNLGFLHQEKGVIMEVLKHFIRVNPLILVLTRIGILNHEVLVLEIVHGGTDKRASDFKMRWHAEFLHVELPLLELLSDPAQDVASLWLGKDAEAGREFHLSIDILDREVEDEDHVRPFIAPRLRFPLLRHPLKTLVNGQPDIMVAL
jgi:hypothetical protein